MKSANKQYKVMNQCSLYYIQKYFFLKSTKTLPKHKIFFYKKHTTKIRNTTFLQLQLYFKLDFSEQTPILNLWGKKTTSNYVNNMFFSEIASIVSNSL